ncbi:MAG: hypothetical protein Q8O19_05955 [Rectinemataceae bacterium]|nr:hypothetical protein [Rectinemataceae bacterium]
MRKVRERDLPLFHQQILKIARAKETDDRKHAPHPRTPKKTRKPNPKSAKSSPKPSAKKDGTKDKKDSESE